MTAETNDELITALYCRLSVEDEKDKRVSDNESNSISNQKQILLDYCKNHGYKNTMFFVDDGISGTSFERSDFQRMQRMAEEGKICRIIVKDDCVIIEPTQKDLENQGFVAGSICF